MLSQPWVLSTIFGVNILVLSLRTTNSRLIQLEVQLPKQSIEMTKQSFRRTTVQVRNDNEDSHGASSTERDNQASAYITRAEMEAMMTAIQEQATRRQEEMMQNLHQMIAQLAQNQNPGAGRPPVRPEEGDGLGGNSPHHSGPAHGDVEQQDNGIRAEAQMNRNEPPPPRRLGGQPDANLTRFP